MHLILWLSVITDMDISPLTRLTKQIRPESPSTVQREETSYLRPARTLTESWDAFYSFSK